MSDSEQSIDAPQIRHHVQPSFPMRLVDGVSTVVPSVLPLFLPYVLGVMLDLHGVILLVLHVLPLCMIHVLLLRQWGAVLSFWRVAVSAALSLLSWSVLLMGVFALTYPMVGSAAGQGVVLLWLFLAIVPVLLVLLPGVLSFPVLMHTGLPRFYWSNRTAWAYRGMLVKRFGGLCCVTLPVLMLCGYVGIKGFLIGLELVLAVFAVAAALTYRDLAVRD